MDGLPRQLEHGCGTCRREMVGRTDGTTVETTGDHPFFIQGKGWTNAESLASGDISPTWAGLKKSGGVVEKEIVFSTREGMVSDSMSGLVLKESLAVVDIEVLEEETTVYNFEVEDDHTYFVTEAEVWVHNAEYTVQKGERVQTVADKFGVSKEALLDANPKAKARGYFLAGEDIEVPDAAASTPEGPSFLDKLGDMATKGLDTLGTIALAPFKYAGHVAYNTGALLGGTIFQKGSIVDFTYGLPQTALGLVGGFGSILLGGEVETHKSATVVKNGLFGGGGMTIGSVIFTGSNPSDALKDHEIGHTYQSRILGPAYLPIIGAPSLFSAIYETKLNRLFGTNWNHNDDMYTEIWANHLADKYAQ